MFSLLSSWARSGVVAIAALSALPAAAPAAPIGPTVMPAVADRALAPTLVQGEGRDHLNPAYQFWRPRYRGGGDWGGRRNWDGPRWNRNWNGDGGWNRRHWRRNHWRRGWGGWGPGIAFGLGVPLGYGLYGGYGGYYDEPVYRPRYYPRYYRSGGSAHSRWCYARYRSYRAWDNTYQPYYGPRRQCISPYS